MHTITRGAGATHSPQDYPNAQNDIPICVCCGVGVDSVAMLIGMHQRGIRPDLITFADTGSEKPETYQYVPILRQWLRDVGFPELVVVRNLSPIAKHKSLYDNCYRNETLPSLAFGLKSCSLKWKKEPQDAWRNRWQPLRDCWDSGRKAIKLIGFDCTETHRGAYSTDSKDGRFRIEYWLQTWEWSREKCQRQIADAGLPVPEKSACFCCPASKKTEIEGLPRDLYSLSVSMEANYRAGRHWRGDNATTVGLGRKFQWSDVDNTSA